MRINDPRAATAQQLAQADDRQTDGAAAHEGRQRTAMGRANPALQARPNQPTPMRNNALEQEPAPPRQGALDAIKTKVYAAGLGRTETRVVSSFGEKTATVTPQRTNTVRQAGEGPTPIPSALTAAARAARETTLPEARVRPDVSALLGEMGTAVSWRETIRRHCNGADMIKAELAADLDQLKAKLGLRDAEVGVLAKCIMSKFLDVRDARVALDGLQRLDVMNQLVQPDPNPTEGSKRAWLLAAQLQAVPGVGLRLLGKLSQRDAANQGCAFGSTEASLVRTYFQAAQEVAQKGGNPQELDPHTLYAQGGLRTAIDAVKQRYGDDAWPGSDGAQLPLGLKLTVAEKALLAVRDVANPASLGTHGCAFALHMVRAGMLTDETRDANGKVTEYHKAESRACKTFGKHLDRALGTERKNPFRAFLEGFAPKRNKSPFFVNDRILVKDKVGFGLAHDNGIHQGRAVKDMIGVVKEALLSARQGHRNAGIRRRDIDQPTADYQARILNQCRLAILNTTESGTALLPRFASGQPLDEAQLLKAKDLAMGTLRTRYSMTDAQRAALAQQVETVLRQENQGLTPQTLLAWGHAAGGPGDAEQLHAIAQAPAAPGSPNWGAFEEAYLYATHQAQPHVDTPPLKGSTRQAASAQLADLIRGEELGSGFKLQNGGLAQGESGPISGIVSRVLLSGVGSLRVDLGGGRQRVVTFESGIDPARSFIKVGVATITRTQAGLGAAAGVGLPGSGVMMGGDVSAAGVYDVVHEEGTIFSFPRDPSAVANGDRELSKKKAQLVELLVAVAGGQDGIADLPKPANAEDKGSLIKSAYQAYGDQISVGRYELKAQNRQTVLAAGTVTQLGLGNVRLGLPEVEIARSTEVNRVEYTESSGALRVNRVAIEAASQGKAELKPAGIQGFPMIRFSADLSRAGTIQTTHRVFQDGEELPSSYATTDYLKPGDFAHALSSNLDSLARDKSARYSGQHHATDPVAPIQVEKRNLVDFAARLLNEGDRSAIPQIYGEFGDAAVEAANLLEADAALSRLLGDEERAQAAQSTLAAIHGDIANQEGRFLLSANARSLEAKGGLNGLLGVTLTRVNKFSEKSTRFT